MIDKLLNIFKAHAKVAVGVFVGFLAILYAVSFLSPRVYETHTAIYVQKKIPSADSGDELNMPSFTDADLIDHVKIMKSNAVLEYVIPRLKEHFPKHSRLTRGAIAKRLRIVNAKNTKVVDLYFQDSDPKYAANVLSLTLEGYEHALKQIARDRTMRSLEFMRDHLVSVQTERHDIEAKLEKLQTDSGTLDIDTKNSELLTIRTTYAQSLGDLNAKVLSAEREMNHLQKLLGLSSQQIKAFSRIKEDPQIKALREKLGQTQASLSELRSTYTDKYTGVIEKKREIQQIEGLIAARLKEVVGVTVNKEEAIFSDLDQAMGQRLLEQNVEYLGYIGQRDYYQQLLDNLDKQFGTLASQKREVNDLQFRLDSLKDEEKKLTNRLQDGNIEQTIFNSLGSFLVVTPPSIPRPSDYIFPLKPRDTILGGFFASFMLSIFSVGLLEHFNPRVINLANIPVLAEVGSRKKGQPLSESDYKSIYQNLALLISKFQYKTITLMHLCGGDDMPLNTHLQGDQDYNYQMPYLKCAYSPVEFARQTSAMFAERGLKTLLVDCSDYCCESNSENEKPVLQIVDHILYENTIFSNLHVLRGKEGEINFFDPYIIKHLPDYETYDLILINTNLSENETASSLLCEAADATLVGISHSQTPSVTVRNFQRIAEDRDIKLAGSVIFP